jgi:hypothetical protein
MPELEAHTMRLTLALLLVLAATPAAAEILGPDAPVVTAGASLAMSVADQIDHYLKTSPAAVREADDVRAAIMRDDRRPHGEIAVGLGTRGYRSFYARTEIPIGEDGRLSLAIGQNRFADRGAWRDNPSSDAFLPAPYDRQRCDLEAMTPERPLDRRSRSQGRCQGALAR